MPDSGQWLSRGMEDLRGGRTVDALICFGRAARADPGSALPLHRLGIALRRLGRVDDAIAAWRRAEANDARLKEVVSARAAASLALGDAGAAYEAASRAVALDPDDGCAALIRAIAAIEIGDPTERAAAVRAVGDILARDPRLAAGEDVAGPLSKALDGVADLPSDAEAAYRAIAELMERSDPAPATLRAWALERALARQDESADRCARLVAAAIRAAYTAADLEALRRIAVATGGFDAAAAHELSRRYAALCREATRPAVSPVWPRRTAGARLRVIALCTPESRASSIVSETLHALRRDAVQVAFATIGPAIVRLIDSDSETDVTLPSLSAEALARLIAARDPDVVLDLVGMQMPVGPFLAWRPGRAIWTVGDLRCANAVPLVDRVFTSAPELSAAIAEAVHSLDALVHCPIDAAAIAAAWADAVRLHESGDRTAAIDRYRRFLELQPGYAPALYLCGMAHREAGDVESAMPAFRAALDAAPDYADARVAAARAAIDAGVPERAIALCEEGLRRTPGRCDLLRVLGNACLAGKDGAAAAAAFELALAIEIGDGETHFKQGVALQAQRRFADAVAAYQRALALRPDLADAAYNLGLLLRDAGSTDGSIAAFEHSIRIDPRSAATYRQLGETLFAAGRFDAWRANFRRFEAACPDALPLAVHALDVCQRTGDLDRLDDYLRALGRMRFRAADDAEFVDCLEEILHLLLYFDLPPDVLLRYARTYDAAARRVYGTPLPAAAERRPGRLRIGYLSGDLRNHVMGKMTWTAIAGHDRSRFELHFYSLSDQQDGWTERFRGLADRFEVIAGIDEREAARRIAAADLDILVDLSTHTKGSRPGILALKPARVQITHIASAGTVGLSAVDFKLTDRFADVPEMQAFQLERFLVMEGCVYPFRQIAPAVRHPFTRESLGLPADAVLIGAFANPLKLSRRCLATWRSVLERVPLARLVFSPTDPAFRDHYLRLAAAGGIASDRLVFMPQGRDERENQSRFGIIDMVLDPMPYGGVNVTLEALGMGVPVVTVAGTRHGERSSYSILANLGVLQTVASSEAHYVEIAARLATDRSFVAQVRDAIRAGLRESRLTNASAHTRALEDAYVLALRGDAPPSPTSAGAGPERAAAAGDGAEVS